MGKIVHVVTLLAHAAAMRERVANDQHATSVEAQQAVVVLTGVIDLGKQVGTDAVGVFRAAVDQSQTHQVTGVVVNGPQVNSHADKEQPDWQHGVGYVDEELAHNWKCQNWK